MRMNPSLKKSFNQQYIKANTLSASELNPKIKPNSKITQNQHRNYIFRPTNTNKKINPILKSNQPYLHQHSPSCHLYSAQI